MSPGGVSYHDRALVVGYTGAGKSALVNHLAGGFRCQRFFIDTKGHEFSIAGVEPVSDVAAIDWGQPVIHYVDRTGSIEEYDEVFAVLERRPNLLTVVHELADLCEHNTHRTPPAVKRYLQKGRASGRGMLGASQRPVGMPMAAKTEVQHVFVMVPPVLLDDLAVIAPLMGMGAVELNDKLHQLEAELGPHSFLWYRRTPPAQLLACKPLPLQAVRSALVRERKLA